MCGKEHALSIMCASLCTWDAVLQPTCIYPLLSQLLFRFLSSLPSLWKVKAMEMITFIKIASTLASADQKPPRTFQAREVICYINFPKNFTVFCSFSTSQLVYNEDERHSHRKLPKFGTCKAQTLRHIIFGYGALIPKVSLHPQWFHPSKLTGCRLNQLVRGQSARCRVIALPHQGYSFWLLLHSRPSLTFT